MSKQNNNFHIILENEDKSKNDLNEQELIIKYIKEMKNEEKRTSSIKNLAKFCEKNTNLAIYLWYTRGTVASILQEIIKVYQYLSPSKLTQEISNEACAAISLFQCLASHKDTRHKFIESRMPVFLFPFLCNTYKSNPFEYIKLTTLGVFGALVKVDDSKVISFLVENEIFPICLRILDRGTELSKCIASFIVLRISLNDEGYKYIFEKEQRLYLIVQFLGSALKCKISPRILKYILRIFARLSENKKARSTLKNILPEEIKNNKFFSVLDDSSKKWVKTLRKNLEENDSEINQKIEKLKNDLTIKNVNTTNDKNLNNINQNKINNFNSGMMINNNNMNVNLMLNNQINLLQPKFMVPPNYGEINYYNGNNNYINEFNMNFPNS
jgi:CCR4-NOT transcription complex subunit 9